MPAAGAGEGLGRAGLTGPAPFRCGHHPGNRREGRLRLGEQKALAELAAEGHQLLLLRGLDAFGGHVPLETMPVWLRIFAENQPVTRVIEAMRGWMVGTPIGENGWIAFLWCAAILAISAPITTYLYRRGN